MEIESFFSSVGTRQHTQDFPDPPALAAYMGNDLIFQQICKVLDLDYEGIKGKLLDPDEAAAVYLAIENLSETLSGIFETAD